MSVWKQVGVIGVDAGLCWIGDPCYVLHQVHHEGGKSKPKPLDIGNTWNEFCVRLSEREVHNDHRFAQWNYDGGHPGLGVSVSTGDGDGEYPVYVKRTSDGRVAEVRVVFIEPESTT